MVKNFEMRSMFGQVMDKSTLTPFLSLQPTATAKFFFAAPCTSFGTMTVSTLSEFFVLSLSISTTAYIKLWLKFVTEIHC